jgi:hypothetical protein
MGNSLGKSSQQVYTHWVLLHVSRRPDGCTRRMVHHIHKTSGDASLCEFRSVGEPTEYLKPLGHTDMTFDEMDVYCQRLSKDHHLNTMATSCREWVDLLVTEMWKDNLLVVDPGTRPGAVYLFSFTSTSPSSIISESDFQTWP